jgi:hypothetical protein
MAAAPSAQARHQVSRPGAVLRGRRAQRALDGTAANAGPSILIVWIAALFCFFIPLAASVMELSSRHPEEGGIYVWTREAFGDFSGFICAWTYWMSNLPFFAGVLYFRRGVGAVRLRPRAQGLAGNPLYYIAFRNVLAGVHHAAQHSRRRRRQVAQQHWRAGQPGAAHGAAAAGQRHRMWRFGPAIHVTRASLVPHWSLDNAVFWSSVFFAFSAIEAASAMGDEIQNPRRAIPWRCLSPAAFSPSATSAARRRCCSRCPRRLSAVPMDS